jgi:hypothetical protein
MNSTDEFKLKGTIHPFRRFRSDPDH